MSNLCRSTRLISQILRLKPRWAVQVTVGETQHSADLLDRHTKSTRTENAATKGKSGMFTKTPFIVLTLICMLSACASGSAVITGTKRSPISASEVRLYTRAPAEYEVIGIVKASSEMGWTSQGSMDYAVEELKKRAAAIGANGILVKAVGGGTATETVSGEAIYVSSKP